MNEQQVKANFGINESLESLALLESETDKIVDKVLNTLLPVLVPENPQVIELDPVPSNHMQYSDIALFMRNKISNIRSNLSVINRILDRVDFIPN